MGHSGSGKSTLVRMLNRLIDPTSGHVEIDGSNIHQLNRNQLIQLRRHKISMVFQNHCLLPHRTVLQNTVLGLEVRGMDKKKREKIAVEILGTLGLSDFLNHFPHQLSGGMQQRVNIARALAPNPDILLLDEPFSSLDPQTKIEIQDLLLSVQARTPRTIIFITHAPEEALRLGDRIAVLEAGRIVQIDTPEAVMKNPVDPYVESFFQTIDPDTFKITSGGKI